MIGLKKKIESFPNEFKLTKTKDKFRLEKVKILIM